MVTKLHAIAAEAFSISREKRVSIKQAVGALISAGRAKEEDLPRLLGIAGRMKFKAKKQEKQEKAERQQKQLQKEVEESMQNPQDDGVDGARPSADPQQTPHAAFSEPPKSLPPATMPGGPVQHVTEIVRKNIEAEFDAVVEKVLMDSYRRAMFEAWKEAYGYEGDLGQFLCDTFDEFMKLRGVTLELVVHKRVGAK